MKKTIRKTICLLLSIVLMSGSFVINAFAAEERDSEVLILEANVIMHDVEPAIGTRSTTFTNTMIIISASSAGMAVTIDTDMNNTASVVGVKDIKVLLKNGDDWITVAVSDGGEVSGYAGCSVSFTYPDAVKGKTYKISCTHYGNVDGYRELYQETDAFVFTY